MRLRDLQICDGRSMEGKYPYLMTRFDDFAVAIVELYLSHLSGVVTEDTAKVVVTLVSPKRGAAPRCDGAGRCIGVDWPFDFAAFDSVDELGQKQRVADALRDALLWVAQQKGWARRPFRDAHAAAARDGLIFQGWLLKKNVKSPDSTMSANCFFVFTPKAIDVFLVVMDAAGQEIQRHHLYTEGVHYDRVRFLVGAVEWVGRRKIRVRPARGSWGVDTHTVSVKGA